MANEPSTSNGMPYEEVFVISDLHLGGVYGAGPDDRGFRINTHADKLVEFLEELCQRAAATRRRTELVINGDFVDFLAEGGAEGEDWLAFVEREEDAVERFEALSSRDFAVFDALHRLLQGGVALTLLLGNHDLELSIPAVREHLRDRLGADRNPGYLFLYDGEAYVTGDSLIEHGNRYDGFNVVDYDTLRRYRSESSRRLPATPEAVFIPPLGSQLVERVMNPIKKDYGFIDLLKPENEAAIPLLLALEPAMARDVAGILDIMELKAEAEKRNPVSGARPRDPRNIAGLNSTGLEGVVELTRHKTDANTAARLTALIHEAAAESARQSGQIASGNVARALSFARLVFLTKEWDDRLALLMDILRQTQGADRFDWSVECDAAYLDAATELAEGGFRNVIFGHTHLPKQVPLARGATYLNTGTWADLMRVPADIYATDQQHAREAWSKFGVAVRNNQFSGYVEFAPSFAFIQSDGSGGSRPGKVHQYEANLVKEL